jgi:hypothetical protein
MRVVGVTTSLSREEVSAMLPDLIKADVSSVSVEDLVRIGRA